MEFNGKAGNWPVAIFSSFHSIAVPTPGLFDNSVCVYLSLCCDQDIQQLDQMLMLLIQLFHADAKFFRPYHWSP
jgi:hypothetical protein